MQLDTTLRKTEVSGFHLLNVCVPLPASLPSDHGGTRELEGTGGISGGVSVEIPKGEADSVLGLGFKRMRKGRKAYDDVVSDCKTRGGERRTRKRGTGRIVKRGGRGGRGGRRNYEEK